MEENNKIPIHADNDGLTRTDVKLEEDSLWLSRARMRELHRTSRANVEEHIRRILSAVKAIIDKSKDNKNSKKEP